MHGPAVCAHPGFTDPESKIVMHSHIILCIGVSDANMTIGDRIISDYSTRLLDAVLPGRRKERPG
jgi:hypothetical protein